MDLVALETAAKAAAARHDHLTQRVQNEAGSPGITVLRVKLRQAAGERIRAENALQAAQEALVG